ncbi:unnamed protein product [Aphanomyces euteiches]|uniref:Proteasome assembly chaperone 1 n=1 Tax=Aphanomyces euteiches TaxID=100861 RepID=A0A6G0WMS5_9STRA|nr:hypothetical protein Ae201684_013603 [Aphanomyces euteiches]KAH9093637.1 hypothetical protein Ae201684P_016263 [Aphanomyces euteiches]
MKLAAAVILGYCDVSLAGVRLLRHVSLDDLQITEEKIEIHGFPLVVRNYEREKEPIVSVVIVPEVIPADECTVFCAELTDLLSGKDVLVLTTLSVPMSTSEESNVFWTQYHPKTTLNLSIETIQPIPTDKWTIKDQFLSTCLHFFQVEQLSTTIVLVRGYKYTKKTNDGTAEVLAKLGSTLPGIVQALCIASKVEFNVQAASYEEIKASIGSTQSLEHALLYN